MKNNRQNLPLSAALLLAANLVGAPILFAADPPPTTPEPAPAQTPPPGGGTGGPGRPGGPGAPGGPDSRRGGDRNFDRGGGFQGRVALGLDEKQRELFREASMKESDQIRKLEERMRTAQKELLHAVIAEKYDENVVREKAEAISKLNVEMTMLRAKALSTVAPTLKPEQREQLENSPMGTALLSGGGFGGYRGPGGPGGPGGPEGGFRGGYRGGDGQPPAGGEQVGEGGGRRGGAPRPPQAPQ